MNTLNEFLKYAKIEQDLYDIFDKSGNLLLESSPQFYDNTHNSSIPPLTTTVKQPQQQYRNTKQNIHLAHPIQVQRSVSKRNSGYEINNRTSTTTYKQTHNYPTQQTFKKTN